MPRPSKFVEWRHQRLLAVLAAGGSRREACRVSDIDPATLRDWLRKGERSTPAGRWARFLSDVRDAEAGCHLVGLPSDSRDSLAWALGVLDRSEWATDPEPPAGPTVIELSLPKEDE